MVSRDLDMHSAQEGYCFDAVGQRHRCNAENRMAHARTHSIDDVTRLDGEDTEWYD